MALILYLLLGIIFANGIPHFVKGITAQEWDVPWEKPAKATTNVLWGVTNWLITVLLWAIFEPVLTILGVIMFFIGMAITGYLLALHWSKKE
ncbi:hypothetical protein IGL98_002444 [Enterococcus sp. DIV0840]|uniref:hypothetical protein n=1 Tax=Enterococcus TaxID=1350 RepID=UPI001A8CF3B3|nr:MULTISPECIES: hypothetical protein [Enterococcus]MBO0433986.1 hypothetical protein [Enterococcus sp. DIV0849a]MBO0474822.1 hypothetical protein [Enterococcus ureasiticus]